MADTVLYRPENPKELYNLRHTQARNVIERIFSILKRWFGILTCPPEYSMEIQVRILPALCALHNFIHIYDNDEILEFDHIDCNSFTPGLREELAAGPTTTREQNRAHALHDKIAQDMWDGYQNYQRGIDES
jgi:DDE superfamily endonuclease